MMHVEQQEFLRSKIKSMSTTEKAVLSLGVGCSVAGLCAFATRRTEFLSPRTFDAIWAQIGKKD